MIIGYQIRDPKSGEIYFSRGPSLGPEAGEAGTIQGVNPMLGIRYTLPKAFLNCKVIASQVHFQNTTDLPLENFVLQETHYLEGKMLQEFKFNLGFVPPKTQNSWEHMYQPEFKRNQKFIDAAMTGPWDVHTKLFIGGEMVMHTQAQLAFK
ncbi:GMP-PDE_delta subunit [Hexamita inflata]|uniref:Putative n=1 Tax=Hexamita inflata TaxID=28002 RepID=A0AA86RN15_9EUKA|nr:GMP-PDE delta subunit [Hexamita inflata]CAI9976071.1 GMP-PDE delta subunit [Hexamita inflata]